MACEDILQRLNDAIDARQRLMTGAQVVIIVDAFRSRVEYRPADSDKLAQYIGLLQTQYQACLNANNPQLDAFGRPIPNTLTKPTQFIF